MPKLNNKNQRLMLQLKLQAELQRTIQLIGKDLRRVGFRAANQKLIEDNLALFELDEKGTAITIAQADKHHQIVVFCFFMIWIAMVVLVKNTQKIPA